MLKIQEYLKTRHESDIKSIIRADVYDDIPFRALQVNFADLANFDQNLYKRIVYRDNIWVERARWTEALDIVQKQILKSMDDGPIKERSEVKNLFPVTFSNYLSTPTTVTVNRYNLTFQLIEVTANVLRTKEKTKMEIRREYKCRKCKQSRTIFANRHYKFAFVDEPTKCIVSRGCTGSMFNIAENEEEIDLDRYTDFQEIQVKIMSEKTSESLTVELDEELAECCNVGDHVTILGVIETRSCKNINDFSLVLRAANVKVHKSVQNFDVDNILEIHCHIYDEWQMDKTRLNGDELKVRDEMISSVAPELEGLAMVKLGLLLTLCSGGAENEELPQESQPLQRIVKREISHFLMVGNPGLGKSQILKAATQISCNAVRTVGYASTAAGLTAGLYREGGHDLIEGGALVKANNGVCCIDEFNLLPKEHRGSVHEVMEHQRVTFLKGSVKAQLTTRCSVIAAMNQKNYSREIESSNLSIEPSLLSRFDLVFDLEDPQDPILDAYIINHILSSVETKIEPKWSLERLQKHVMIAKEIVIKITSEAQQVISRYFILCKNNDDIEPSRRTMRLMTSLERLTKCHARLMLRREAVIEDALNVIMVMEQSWSFGKLLQKTNNVKVKLPIAMEFRTMSRIMETLDLEDIWEIYLDSKFKQPEVTQRRSAVKKSQEFSQKDLKSLFNDSEEEEMDITESTEIEKDYPSGVLQPSSSSKISKRPSSPPPPASINLETKKPKISSSVEKLEEFPIMISENGLQDELEKLSSLLCGGNENNTNAESSKTEMKNSPKSDTNSRSWKGENSVASKLKKFIYQSQDEIRNISQNPPEQELNGKESRRREEMDVDDDFELWSALTQIEEKDKVKVNTQKNITQSKTEPPVATANNFDFEFDLWSPIE